MIAELDGGITRGFVRFELLVIVIDKYAFVLFRKTQKDPTGDVDAVGSVIPTNPEFVIL